MIGIDFDEYSMKYFKWQKGPGYVSNKARGYEDLDLPAGQGRAVKY